MTENNSMQQALIEDQKGFASELVFMIDKARRLGLYKTSHRLHDASRELGWEMAGMPMPDSEPLYCETDGVRRELKRKNNGK